MIFLVVNYHYLGKENIYKNGIFPVSAERFSRQLDLLKEHFTFISQEDLLNAVDGGNSLPEKCCLITFDDGLRCQHEIALPILKKKNVPAVFFVTSLPYVDKKACLVHKTHYVLARYSINDIIKELAGILKSNYPGTSLKEIMEEIKAEARAKHKYDDQITASVKMLLGADRAFDMAQREQIISGLFKKLVADEKKFAERLYLDGAQIKDLYHLGMLGLHSHAHQSLARLTKRRLEDDLKINKAIVEKIVQGEVKSISFPHGGTRDIDQKVLSVAKKLDFKIGFTMERSFNISLKCPLAFARLNTNDAPNGTKPLFSLKGNEINILPGMASKREMFFRE